MSRVKIYNTKQKDVLLKFIKKQKHEFTINDIYGGLDKQVGLTTIYRFIDKLIEDGFVSKFINNNITYYQYFEKCNEENHFYLKCNNCGKTTHVDCDCINELSEHITKNHKFLLDREKVIINGLCDKCIKKNNM